MRAQYAPALLGATQPLWVRPSAHALPALQRLLDPQQGQRRELAKPVGGQRTSFRPEPLRSYRYSGSIPKERVPSWQDKPIHDRARRGGLGASVTPGQGGILGGLGRRGRRRFSTEEERVILATVKIEDFDEFLGHLFNQGSRKAEAAWLQGVARLSRSQ
jgi:hypothetical protein